MIKTADPKSGLRREALKRDDMKRIDSTCVPKWCGGDVVV